MSDQPKHTHHHGDAHHHAHGQHHGHGHNHPQGDHLHSHVHGGHQSARIEEMQELAASFIDGFRSAEDKTSYLRLAHIPFTIDGEDGLKMNLVDAAINSNWQIGTASPAFASRELVYMPFPGKMVQHREKMTFTYVSLTGRRDVDLTEFLSRSLEADSDHHHNGH